MTRQTIRALLVTPVAMLCGLSFSLAATLILAPPARCQDWVTIPSGTTADLRDFTDSTNWDVVVGDAGTLLRSSDNGLTWAPLDCGTNVDLASIEVHSQTLWWAAGAEGTVRYSGNTGQDWEDRSPATTDVTLHLFSRSGGVAYAVGAQGTILKTTNRGVDWTTHVSGTSSDLYDGEGFNGGPAHAVGDNGTILRTANGVDWTTIDTGVTAGLRAFAETSYRLAVGTGGTILKSTDSGFTWVQKESGVTEDLLGVDVSGGTSARVVAVGTNGTIIKSTDSGESWCASSSGTTADLCAAHYQNNSIIMVFGEGGLILRTENGGGVCRFPADAPAPSIPQLAGGLSVSPNPIRSFGQITLQVEGGQRVRLRLLDLQGRTRRILHESVLEGGRPQVIPFRAGGLASGSYYIVAEGEDFHRRQKLLVVR